MFARGRRAGVAVSGGADSVCLLYLLRELATTLGLSLTILHLNHQLRADESDSDAEFVQKLGNSLGLSTVVECADIRSVRDNLEQAGREARRQFFTKLIAANRLDVVATGHTQSDQAETVLYRLLRGSGTAGLAGVRPVTPDGLIRPLLDCKREQVESYLRERGIHWREDSTNRDREFVRNRIRHDLLPQLMKDYNPALPQTLAQTAVLAQDEEQYWNGEVDRIAERLLTRQGHAVLLVCRDLLALPRAAARRVLRRAIELVKGDLRSIGFEHVESLLKLAGGGEGHGRLQLPDLDVFRSFDWLRIARPRVGAREEFDYRMELPMPGCVSIPGAALSIHLDLVDFSTGCPDVTAKTGYTEDETAIDGGRARGPFELRNWRPGDQYARVGRCNEKIKFLFQQERIPIWERQGWPIITSSGKIVWARKFGVAAEFACSAKTRQVIRVSEIADSRLTNVT